MKLKYAVVLVAIGLALAAILIETRSGSRSEGRNAAALAAPKVLLLKSNGSVVADLKVRRGIGVGITSQSLDFNVGTKQMSYVGSVSIKIAEAGGSPVTVLADEVDTSAGK
jgi:hypothetical protein